MYRQICYFRNSKKDIYVKPCMLRIYDRDTVAFNQDNKEPELMLIRVRIGSNLEIDPTTAHPHRFFWNRGWEGERRRSEASMAETLISSSESRMEPVDLEDIRRWGIRCYSESWSLLVAFFFPIIRWWMMLLPFFRLEIENLKSLKGALRYAKEALHLVRCLVGWCEQVRRLLLWSPGPLFFLFPLSNFTTTAILFVSTLAIR